ncbi:MAG TPA: long-chain fatty acid--CoA ligase [Gemmatimonadaceae bacterium]|nr:long-chain fatty acid--CoA ligase [Gemmatimonadaceae bacterium]
MTVTAEPNASTTRDPHLAPTTLTRLFFDAVAGYDRPNAMQVKVGGAYQPISHRTLATRVRHAAFGLRALGVPDGAVVAILSENRPEWAIADYACLTAHYLDVPIYPTLPDEQIAYILRDSGTVAIFVSTTAQAQKVAAVRASLPGLTWVIAFDDVSGNGIDMTLAALEARGAAAETPDAAARYRDDAMAIAPDQVATIVYTSGTTGEPKGAMLTHGNMASNVAAVAKVIPITDHDASLSFLPLSHVLQRHFDFLMFATGVSIAYVESMDTITVNMTEIRPTLVVAVPRVYEKIYARVLENALASGAFKKRVFFWARAVGERWADVRLAGRPPNPLLATQYAIAKKLVFSKLRERVGGRLRYFVSGGAPLAPAINRFFYAAGLVILEGYGLTETSPVIAVNTPDRYRIGTVGPPISGVDVAIAPDGEILCRGPNVMKGYYNKPEATHEAIDDAGWFHTGDIGVIEDGFLRITDRKKDLIVTAGGKKVAPQPIENQIKLNKYVSQAVMIGDQRKFPIVLVVPNFEQLEKWAKLKNLLYVDHKQLLAQPMVRAKMEKEVLGKLTGLAHFEAPKKMALLDRDFTVDSGELTPTLKVRRRVIDKKFKTLIDRIYAESDTATDA